MDYDTETQRWYHAVVVLDGTTSEPISTPFINAPFPGTITAIPAANATISVTIATHDEIEAETADWFDAAEIPVLVMGPITAFRCAAAGANVTLRALICG